MTPLHALARAVGLSRDWEDAAGKAQRVSDEALAAVLGALGYPAGKAADIRDSLDRIRASEEGAAAGFVSADVGRPIALPGISDGRAELRLESGERRDVRVTEGRIVGIDEPGYHQLELGAGAIRIAVAPARCFSVADACGEERLWGPAVQIPALRGGGADGFGDFGALADAGTAFAARGADLLAVSPVHALFPADPARFSPYAPSSRLFLNVLLGDPRRAGMGGGGDEDAPLIDWQAAIPRRLERLRCAFDGRSDAVRVAVAAYADEGGDELLRHARFDALHAHFFAGGAHGWQDWPTPFHDPAGEAVAAFAAEHGAEVGFFLFAQWLADDSLRAAQAASQAGGMALGLIADLAVGMDGGGSHAWSRRDELLTGLSIGAPPDLLGPDGQNWGITGFAPDALRRTGFDAFIATIRTALAHASGIRIDHALGLQRLWVVPDGASAKEGAYLAMPLDDMLRIVAIESMKAKAVVIGEDLGTVPDGFRPKLDARGILGMRVLPFERDAAGATTSADAWDAEAAAMTGTHDLATVAGWWSGRDIDWTWDLGRASGAASEADARAERDGERVALWSAVQAAGQAEGDAPPANAPDAAVDAALGFVASTPCRLAILPVEDLLGEREQPNLPGTIDEHPNWRRRLPADSASLLQREDVSRRIAIIEKARSE